MEKEIIIGSDHAGYEMKEKIKNHLKRKGYRVIDEGTHDKKAVDYPIYAKKVAEETVKRRSKGILICGSGAGMMIAANKVPGVRAAMAYDKYSAEMARKDNDANILTLRARGFSYERNKRIVDHWLNTRFSNKTRHKRRIKEISLMEPTRK